MKVITLIPSLLFYTMLTHGSYQAPYVTLQTAIPVTSSQFLPSGIFTITKPGTYYFPCSLTITESANNNPLIRIATSGVVLDFQNNILQGAQAFTGNAGIEVAAGVSSVIIRNGTIQGTSGNGIAIKSGTQNITVQNMLIADTTDTALVVTGTALSPAHNIATAQVTINGVSGAAAVRGISLEYVQGASLYQTTIGQITSVASAVYGMQIANCNRVLLDSCTIANSDGVSFTGIYADTCEWFETTQCAIEANEATGGNCIGLLFASGARCLASQLTVSFNGTVGTGSTKGITLQDSESCEINTANITANFSENSTVGIELDGNSSTAITDNLIQGNRTLGASAMSTTIGIWVHNTEQLPTISNNRCKSNTSANGECYGMYIESTTLGCTIENNVLINNNGAAKNYGIYDLTSLDPSVWIRNTSIGHGSIYLPGSSATALQNYMNYYSPWLVAENMPWRMVFESLRVNFKELSLKNDFLNLSIP